MPGHEKVTKHRREAAESSPLNVTQIGARELG
jgi:hypothetical protein